MDCAGKARLLMCVLVRKISVTFQDGSSVIAGPIFGLSRLFVYFIVASRNKKLLKNVRGSA
jgi:hypothetical protein